MDSESKLPKEKERSARGEVYDWIQCVIAALIFCVNSVVTGASAKRLCLSLPSGR